MSKLTVITPTYDRASTLSGCWESLRRQTCRDFQWLIIDDGSTDGTGDIVQGFRDASPEMCIDYIYKENGGKHTALNTSHPYIKGDYVAILDSDDTLIPTAVEEILAAWAQFSAQKEVGRVIFLKGY